MIFTLSCNLTLPYQTYQKCFVKYLISWKTAVKTPFPHKKSKWTNSISRRQANKSLNSISNPTDILIGRIYPISYSLIIAYDRSTSLFATVLLMLATVNWDAYSIKLVTVNSGMVKSLTNSYAVGVVS